MMFVYVYSWLIAGSLACLWWLVTNRGRLDLLTLCVLMAMGPISIGALVILAINDHIEEWSQRRRWRERRKRRRR